MTKTTMAVILAGTLLSPSWAGARQNRLYLVNLKARNVEIPFVIELPDTLPGDFAVVQNGSERINVPKTTETMNSLTLEFTCYDSIIEAQKTPMGLTGVWKKRASNGEWSSIDLTAVSIPWSQKPLRFPRNYKVTEEIEKPTTVNGRWTVTFGCDDSPAIGVFKEAKDKSVEGTFLTTTGDYRYLAGSYEHGLLRLSCFDGSHAFLFHATMQSDGTLKGDFWSGAKWHETWTAKRDDKAALPDGFSLTRINPNSKLKDLKFPDLDGTVRSLSEPGLLGKATIVEVFGSWCPNCHDAAELLVDLEKKYGSRGLKVVGLAFESGNSEHDARQVKRYLERHQASYTALLAGVRDRKKASAVLPVIEELKSFPTFFFVDSDGTIRSVYSGFSGPATGNEYTKLRKQFEGTIEKLLTSGS